jgi:hypothetical protein
MTKVVHVVCSVDSQILLPATSQSRGMWLTFIVFWVMRQLLLKFALQNVIIVAEGQVLIIRPSDPQACKGAGVILRNYQQQHRHHFHYYYFYY